MILDYSRHSHSRISFVVQIRIMHPRRTYLLYNVFLAIAALSIRSCDADCLVGDMIYKEGESTGHIGLECIDDSTYEGSASTCGPAGAIVEEEQMFSCPASVPYCVQCGPRGWGAALCLSTPTTDRDCGEPDYYETNPIVCPDGQDPIPDTFCGRGLNRSNCAEDKFCFIEPADRFAVCCPYPENCCDSDAHDASVWEWGNYCCSDGNWYAVDGSGGGTCQERQLQDSVACPSVSVKCCDPETGPGGCPDENGSFDRCWDEGGFCCSDGNWYANDGAGGNNCQDNQLEDSQACTEVPVDDTSGADQTLLSLTELLLAPGATLFVVCLL